MCTRGRHCDSQGEASFNLAIQQKTYTSLGRLTAFCLALLCAAACHREAGPTKTIEPTYDKKTGRLSLLRYDSDGDGKFDTFSYMDGTRILRIEIDRNEDGKIDRWEYYGPDQTLEKVGVSRAQDGVADAWSYPDASGGVARVEISTRRNGKIDRVEYYEKGVLVRDEEDSDGDGRFDKWDTYDGERLASVAFDTLHRGTPDRRLIYGADGSVRLEVDPQGTGTFVPVNAPAPRAARSSR